MLRNIIIEGVDRLGKDTLIGSIKQRLGFFQVVHYQKPELLECYIADSQRDLNRTTVDEDVKKNALQRYQVQSFTEMFHMLSSPAKFLLNRAHLGEAVYSPRYRKYSGNYVFDLERKFINDHGSKFHEQTLLVLLHTSSFDFIKDDGLSFDFDKKDEEQNDFIRGFERSSIVHKLMLDVHDGAGNFIPAEKVLETVLWAYSEIRHLPQSIVNVSWENNDEGLKRRTYFQVDPNKIVM